MAIEAIGRAPDPAQSNVQTQGLGQEDFMKILLTQLTYQDPLKPLDNQQFIAQMAQFSALEQTRATNDQIELLLSIQSATQSIGLIGKTVEVATASGRVVGSVTTLTFNNGQPTFTVKTASNEFLNGVTLSQISVVR